ncbi:MAG: hypothetical protein ABH827_00835 [bacterium]
MKILFFFYLTSCSVVFAQIKIVQKVAQENTQMPTTPVTREANPNQLAQSFILAEYLKTILEMTLTYHENHAQEPEVTCINCQKKLSSGVFFTGIAGMALHDFVERKNNYEYMKKNLDKSIELLSSGSPDEITEFMLQVANEVHFPCTKCHTNSWIIQN